MKFRVNSRASSPESKFSWWVRDSSEVARTYQELFPDSYLPSISRYAFWLMVAAALVFLSISLWKSN